MMIPDATGVILAGGASFRFGSNKALASFSGEPLIKHVAAPLVDLFADKLLVTSDPDSYDFLGWPMVADFFAGCGPLGGIHAALKTITTSRAFVVGCDMPFVSKNLIENLCQQPGEWDVALPWLDGRPEPLFAVYQRHLLPLVEEALVRGDYKIGFFLRSLRLRKIERQQVVDLCGGTKVFHNINFQHDLLNAAIVDGENDRRD